MKEQPYFNIKRNEYGRPFFFYSPAKGEPGRYSCWMSVDETFVLEFEKIQISEKTQLKRSSLLANFFLFTLITFLIFITGVQIDGVFFNSRFSNHFIYKDCCDYVVSDDWAIVKNTDGLYAVKKNNEYEVYLTEVRYVREMYINISEPSLFFTDCKAKAYLKEYLKSMEPKMKFE
jgi:hypothetical protein